MTPLVRDAILTNAAACEYALAAEARAVERGDFEHAAAMADAAAARSADAFEWAALL